MVSEWLRLLAREHTPDRPAPRGVAGITARRTDRQLRSRVCLAGELLVSSLRRDTQRQKPIAAAIHPTHPIEPISEAFVLVTDPVTQASDSTFGRGAVWAWGLAAAWALFVWGLGGDDLSLEGTSRFLGPLIRWLLPDVTVETSKLIQFMIRKAAHVTEYGVLSFLILRAMLFAPGGATTRRIVIAAGLAIAFAAADETRQSLSALRLGSIYDVGLDSLGALAGVGGLLLLRRPLPGLGGSTSLLGPEDSISK